jgi:signal transduction histidine kinase
MSRLLRFGLFPAAVVLGIFAEWAALRRAPFEATASAADVRLAAADLVVGVVLVGSGVVAWDRRPESWAGRLLAATGFAWFLGTFSVSGWPGFAGFGSLFVTLHRGPLSHALLGYPSGRVTRRSEQAAIAGLYILSAVVVAADTAAGMLVTASVVLAVAVLRYLRSTGPERRARLVAAAAATAFSAVLTVSACVRLAGAGAVDERGVLWAYDIVIVLISVALVLDLLLERWTHVTVTGLVVDLGALDETAPLRDRLAAALGDPSLEIGYRLPERDGYVDDAGRVLDLPDESSGRAVTILRQDDEPLAALVHDSSVLGDAELLESLAAAARLAVGNARLQAEVRSQLDEIEASRRRIVEAADTQRRRLERELRDGAEQRLSEVAALLDETGEEGDAAFLALLAETRAELGRAQAELIELARGIHPRGLTEGGLAVALAELASRSAVAVDLMVAEERFPAPIEAAAYFVCSEALANVAKHAQASRVGIEVARRDRVLALSVRDDGQGGASLDSGSGLGGLVDRVEAFGGRLHVASPPGRGTVVSAELPLS